MPKDLYTQSEIKEEKTRLYLKQKGIDPIFQEAIALKDSVCDHDHSSQHCRAALHRQTNAFEGLVFNAYKRCLAWVTDKPLPDILRNLATYLEQDYSENALHNGWMKACKVAFNRLNAKQMDSVLTALGRSAGKNLAERKKIFASLVLDRNLGYNSIKKQIETASKLNN